MFCQFLSNILYFFARLLRPLVPFFSRFPVAWKVRRFCFAETDVASWLHRNGALPGQGVGPERVGEILFLLDVRGRQPEAAARAITLVQAQYGLQEGGLLLLAEVPETWAQPATTQARLPELLAHVEVVVCLTADCLPRPDLCTLFFQAFSQHPAAALAYCDEVYHDAQGEISDIFCKPAWDPLLFARNGYCGDLFAVRACFFNAYLKENREPLPGGAALMAACLAHCQGTVLHIPSPLFATRARPPRRPQATADTLPAEVAQPSVSIILPFKNRHDLLQPCVESLIKKTDYPHWHCILVDNGSTCPKTLAYVQGLDGEKFSVVRVDVPFNFSVLINKGAEIARGEVLVLLNSDTEVLTPGWLASLASLTIRPGIGCVGSTLLYPNGMVQHAGIVMGLGGLMHKQPMMGHAHAGWPYDGLGYHGLLAHLRTVSAVTGAALAVRRSIFQQVGGFDELFPQSFNDVDFCLKVFTLGLRNVISPEALLYHYESGSRGWYKKREKAANLRHIYDCMCARWGALLHEDMWYNPNLSSGFSHVLSPKPRLRKVRELTILNACEQEFSLSSRMK